MPKKRHDCETECLNYQKKVKAAVAVKGSFEIGEEIQLCQLCKGQDHLLKEQK